MINKHFNIYRFVTALAAALMLTGCADSLGSIFGNDGEIEVGEKVQFTTMVPDVTASSRSIKTEWEAKVKAYKAVQHAYTFNVEMWKEGAAEKTAYNTYSPKQTTNVGAEVIAKYDGTLQSASETEMYWQDNTNKWGFKAEANNNVLSADQNSQEKWLSMDYLKGHSYLPIWTGEENSGSGTDPEQIQYKTNKEWYADNKTAKDLSGLMADENEGNNIYKKIPLYMQHQRSWITIILKAGEGVKRDALRYATSDENIKMTINSFAEATSEPFPIDKAWSREAFIDYPKDKNGEAEQHVSTTRYDAIVMPHNYATKKDEEVIAKINLSNQNFSFYAGNDERYLSGHSDAEKAAADAAYDLKAGKHLTIEVTLSRESRKILITAWIEDWTEVTTATICDDYGQNGDPVVIKSKQELIAFLSNPNVNKQGSVGIIQPIELDLDGNEDWSGNYDLNATLNLAGCTLKTKHQLFKKMSSSGNLVNGTVLVGDGAVVKYAIADYNDGTIERVNVTTSGENSTAKATVAGMVGWNSGTIYQCSSTLPVYATVSPTIKGATEQEEYTGYIGGIAAVSQAHETTSMAVIDHCTVNASVNSAASGVKGGGIVGYATGRVSNNTNEYGISLSQSVGNYKNIFAFAGTLRAYGNGWPTKAINQIGDAAGTNPNEYAKDKFDAVIDCQAELHSLMNDASKNLTGMNYRISKSFTVTSTQDQQTDWLHGTVNEDYAASAANNVSFNLEGNDKTITLTGTKQVITTNGANLSDGTPTTYTTAPMLFNYVLGEIKNLTIYLEKPLVASPTERTETKDGAETTTYNAADAIAPLAYAVYGANAKLTNIKVKANNEAYVQASTPAGLVVWAYGGATITNSKVKVPIRMWLPESMGSDAKHYAGGIVACAATACITQSQYLGNDEHALAKATTSTSATKSSNYYYGGIVGGTAIKGTDKPNLQISDCSSWYIALAPKDTNKSTQGAIIASTCYPDTDSSNTITNGMSNEKVSEGNWWRTSAIGAGEWASNLNEEKVIGKKNSVEPSYDQDFDKQ